MTEIITLAQPPGQMAVPQKSYPQRLIDVLDRALHDTSIPMDRIERTILLVKDAMADEALRAYAEDFSRLQEVLPTFEEKGQIVIKAGAKPQTYALWSDINRQLRPLLAQFGFGLSFRVATPTDKMVSVTGILLHRAGHKETSEPFNLPHDVTGSKNAVQAYGSTVSYGKRYVASAMLNLTSSAEIDDDGATAGGSGALSEEQAAEIRALIVEAGADIKLFLVHMGLPEGAKIDDIRAADFAKAKEALEYKKQVEAAKKAGAKKVEGDAAGQR